MPRELRICAEYPGHNKHFFPMSTITAPAPELWWFVSGRRSKRHVSHVVCTHGVLWSLSVLSPSSLNGTPALYVRM